MKSLNATSDISIGFRKFFLVGLLALILCFNISCGKKDDGKSDSAAKKKSSPTPVITAVELDPPEPKSSDFIRVQTKLENPRMTYVTYSYMWFVNGSAIEEDMDTLDKKHYKKGDKIYCRVIAAKGVYKSKPVESKEVKILNSPPVFNLVPVNAFKVPGTFEYAIKASDHDGDKLTYLLVAPQDMGIDINPETGVITWEIQEVPRYIPEEAGVTNRPEGDDAPAAKQKPEDASPKLTSMVKLIFEVRDTEGAVVRAAIDLNLDKGREIPE
jgi:hypothetical protein